MALIGHPIVAQFSFAYGPFLIGCLCTSILCEFTLLQALLKSATSRYMDLHLSAGADNHVRIVERPGKWMDADEIHDLSENLIEIASQTLERGSLTYGVFSGDPKRLEHSVITLVTRKSDGKPIAFNALAVLDLKMAGRPVEALHLGLVMVDPNEQSRGLSWVLYGLTCILFFFRNQLRPMWISNVTQVPAIVGMVAETFSNVFPSPDTNNPCSLKHLLVARQIMADHRHVFGVGDDAAFDEQRFVITNAYTGGSDDLKKPFEQAQHHRQNVFNEFCKAELDYDRGDDVIQLGQIDLKTVRKYLLNSVPKRSLLSVVAALGFTVLQRYVLPLIYWFDASKDWRTLRGRKA